jgi:hypothetical protein
LALSRKLDITKGIGIKMKKHMLDDKVFYYEEAVKNFDEVMSAIQELNELGSTESIPLWEPWTSSNDKSFIYGETQSFDINQINNMPEPYKSKSELIYNSIMESLYEVSKDYAESVGDTDEPRLFPVFNIKKYNTGTAMGAHYDQLDGDTTLRYSLVMYLNDDCEGGEISFKLSDYKDHNKVQSPDLDYDVALSSNQIDFGIKPKAGSVIIFPSSAPYYHIAHRVKSGVKYMVPSHWIHNSMQMRDGK